MRQLFLLALLAAAAILPLAAQDSSSCSYDWCALRVRSSFWGASLARGIADERVARIGVFAPHLPLFAQRGDSAAKYYAAFRSRHNTGSTLALVGSALLLGSAIAIGSDSDVAGGLLVASIPITLIGAAFHGSANERLSRAVWWHNRGLSP